MSDNTAFENAFQVLKTILENLEFKTKMIEIINEKTEEKND
tara:strand:+ start:118 stop:240 length:123 start_codon:yes stop_codon:yes gene_type:complete